MGSGRGEEVDGDEEGACEDAEDSEDVAQHGDKSYEDGGIRPDIGHHIGLCGAEDGARPSEWSLGQ